MIIKIIGWSIFLLFAGAVLVLLWKMLVYVLTNIPGIDN